MTEQSEMTMHRDPDTVLRIIVDGINMHEERQEGFQLTLLINGTVLTGKVIPNWQWFEEMDKRPDSKAGESEEDQSDGFMKEIADQLLEQNQLRRSSFDTPVEDWSEEQRKAHDNETRFVHMIDASLLLGGGVMAPSDGGRFRVRIGDVDGWTFGQLSVGRA